MSFKKFYRTFSIIWMIFILSLFVIPRFPVASDFVNRYAWTIAGFLITMMAVYGALHATETIGWVRSRRPAVFNRLFPKPGDEKLVILVQLAAAIFALAVAIFGGLGWLQL